MRSQGHAQIVKVIANPHTGDQLIFDKEPRTLHGKGIASSTNGFGKPGPLLYSQKS